MIVELPYLQAYACDGCGKMYEMRRLSGSEDEMNKVLDFKKRIQMRHEDCKPKEAMKPSIVPVQQGVEAVIQ